MTHQFELCPECGSGKIEMGALIGEDMEATCLSCGWKGPHRELMASIIRQSDVSSEVGAVLGSPDLALGIAQEVAKAYMVLIAKYAAQGLGLAMIEAGVIGKEQPKELTRLIRAASMGAHKATLEEIEAIQKELQHERRESDN